MSEIREIIQRNKDLKIALYGIGSETARFLKELGNEIRIVGLLDGFREEGIIYGHSIISMQQAIDQGVHLIIVIARPGSCKAITKRIGEICRKNNVLLYDIRGRDLLLKKEASFDFNEVPGECRAELIRRIDRADIVSFDLFDTLVMRKVFDYTGVFELLGSRLAEQGIRIPGFAKHRLSAEKECSVEYAPDLTEIYREVLRRIGRSPISAEELAEMEWELDRSLLLQRSSVCEIFRYVVKQGKRVVITSDSYYHEDQIRAILSTFHLEGFEELFISCEKGTAKTGRLFEYLRDMKSDNSGDILHIGDDEAADIESAKKYGFNVYRLFSGAELFDLLGGLGTEKEIVCLADRVKMGLFVSRMFNDPFVFEEGERRLSVPDAFDIGYLFCAPMISDFLFWLRDRVDQEQIPQILFCARDGFLVEKLYRRIDKQTRSFYFLTSRTAAIRAGVSNYDDIVYVDSMKYFGTEEESLRVRFGIEPKDIQNSRNEAILDRSKVLRRNYKEYISGLDILNDTAAMFDFVAKGTTQMYLQKFFDPHIRGFYFLQLEPESMADRGLDIEPFYSDDEKNTSVIYENYYILETLLTSPSPSLEEFDENGDPVYSKETRTEQSIQCIMRAQKGIEAYFDDLTDILPETERVWNKRLDEMYLSLLNHIKINDEEFMSLVVEDPFFCRMTAISDVIT